MNINEIEAHERLRGNTWLVDDVSKSLNNAWKKVKEAIVGLIVEDHYEA